MLFGGYLVSKYLYNIFNDNIIIIVEQEQKQNG